MHFLKFILLSGAGWVLDFALFTLGVRFLHTHEGATNFVSATIAAMTVFVLAQRMIFQPKKQSLQSTAVYFAWTEANIIFWSLTITVLTGALMRAGLTGDGAAAMAAKIAVTPLSMISNYLVARRLDRRSKPEGAVMTSGQATDRSSSRGRVLIFIPAYNCAGQIGRVIAQLDASWVRKAATQAIVVDNRSTDATFAAATAAAGHTDGFVKVFRNAENMGLGGSHKVAFDYAKGHGFDWILVLHGDDQGSISDFRPVFEGALMNETDAVLGSRFMRGSRTPGYSRFRIFGNHIFNLIYSAALGRRIRDLGSGLNLLRVAAVSNELERAPDDLTFNCALLCSLAFGRARMTFYPISWREDDQVSNVKLLRQSWRTLAIAARAFFSRRKFFMADHCAVPRSYSYRALQQ